MKRLLLIGLWLTLTLNQMALAQPFVRLYGEDGTNATSSSNPLPTSASVTVDSIESITDPVGILGANGSAITSSTNPFPIRLSVDGTNFMDDTHGGYVNLLQGNAVLDNGNPLPVTVISGGGYELVGVKGADGAAISSTMNALQVQLCQDNIPVGVANPLIVGMFVNESSGPIGVKGTSGTAIASPTNPVDVRPSADGTNPVDETHGLYTNLLQTNAVISQSNPVPTQLSDGTTAISTTNPLATRPSADGTNPVDATHPLAVQLSQSDAATTAQNPIFAAPSGVVQASITNTNTAIPDASTQVTLAAASAHIRIHNNSSTETLYVDLTDDTATSADYAILPGDSMEPYDGAPLAGFKVIGTNAADTYNVLAW
jgi:hypothetical protein